MLHQMKGVEDGRQDVYLLFLNTWRTMEEHSDQVNLEWLIFIVSYEEMLYTFQLMFNLVATN